MSEMPYQTRVVDRPEDKRLVQAFVDEQYLRVFGTTPPMPDVYAAAYKNGILLACMGIDYADAGGIFSVERIHRIRRNKSERMFTEKDTVQYGRLTGVDTVATFIAIYQATFFARQNLGRTYAIVEHDPIVHRRYARAGIGFFNLHCEGFNLEAVAEANRPYYSKKSMKPYLVELSQILSAIGNRVEDQASFEAR